MIDTKFTQTILRFADCIKTRDADVVKYTKHETTNSKKLIVLDIVLRWLMNTAGAEKFQWDEELHKDFVLVLKNSILVEWLVFDGMVMSLSNVTIDEQTKVYEWLRHNYNPLLHA